ncbi:MAG TPA: hypothetical protein VMV14_04700 [Acidimicrobiales bacterium]|nr:hypothetical protein [Acidimicrobiales bacterium]
MEDRTERSNRFDGSIGASAFTGHGRPSRVFPRGRTCDQDGCQTKLSIYNDGHYCYQHEPQATPRMRGKKIA